MLQSRREAGTLLKNRDGGPRKQSRPAFSAHWIGECRQVRACGNTASETEARNALPTQAAVPNQDPCGSALAKGAIHLLSRFWFARDTRMHRSLIIPAFLSVLLSASAGAYAADRVVEVTNKTGQTMVEFYASVTSTNSWEEDILDEDVLEDGDSVDVNVDDGSGKCIYDFRAIFESGAEAIKRGVNVCQISTFTFTR